MKPMILEYRSRHREPILKQNEPVKTGRELRRERREQERKNKKR